MAHSRQLLESVRTVITMRHKASTHSNNYANSCVPGEAFGIWFACQVGSLLAKSHDAMVVVFTRVIPVPSPKGALAGNRPIDSGELSAFNRPRKPMPFNPTFLIAFSLLAGCSPEGSAQNHV
jgi:hypothetical protein